MAKIPQKIPTGLVKTTKMLKMPRIIVEDSKCI